MMALTEKLLVVADTYCVAVNRSQSRVSTLIFGSGDRLPGIARGNDLGTRNYEKAMLWFAANWPEGVAWPEGVERPEFADTESAAPEQAVA